MVFSRRMRALGITTLSRALDYLALNGGGGGGGGADPSCPPCASPVTIQRDASGVITGKTYGAPVVRTTTLTRNAEGQVDTRVDEWAGFRRTCTHAYDASGRLTTTTCNTEVVP